MVSKSKFIAVCFIVGIMMFWLGFELGQFTALNWCVDQAKIILSFNGIDVGVHSEIITAGVFAYKNRIAEIAQEYQFQCT